uniref:Uncharacterized protein n=1 Tax=viral metagenome TaxID=1070528 RepID=A0A6C0JPH5_9ZZZZ
MKASYRNDLKEFYSKKSAIDEKMKQKLKKATNVEKKKEVIEHSKQQLQEDEVDEDDLKLLRQPFIRMVDYLKQLDDELKIVYERYNEFKLNILYEHTNSSETQLKEIEEYEAHIEGLKQLKLKYLLKITKKNDDINEVIKDIKIKISERQQEYNDSDDIEEKKKIYTETLELKLQIFELIRENISIVNIESNTNDVVSKYSTLVIDYTPIKHNQKKLIKEGQVEVVGENPLLGNVEGEKPLLGDVEVLDQVEELPSKQGNSF